MLKCLENSIQSVKSVAQIFELIAKQTFFSVALKQRLKLNFHPNVVIDLVILEFQLSFTKVFWPISS